MLRFLSRGWAALVLVAASASVPGHAKTTELRWSELPALPPAPGQTRQAGLASPFVGVHGNALIVAGGANFPEKMPWEGGAKVWWDDIAVLEKGADGATRWVTDKNFKLPRRIGYGVSASTTEGVVCVGGSDPERCYAEVFLLAWDAKARVVRTTALPPLPEPLANMAGALVGQTLYVAGGQHVMKGAVATKVFWALDLAPPARAKDLKWEALPAWPGPARVLPVAAAQRTARGSEFFLFGGRTPRAGQATEILRDGYAFDPQTRTWRTLPKIGGGAGASVMAGTAAAVGDDEILLFGGDRGAPEREAENLRKSSRLRARGVCLRHASRDVARGCANSGKRCAASHDHRGDVERRYCDSERRDSAGRPHAEGRAGHAGVAVAGPVAARVGRQARQLIGWSRRVVCGDGPDVPSHSLPQRQSLVAQTVAFLNAQIERGEWREWLPSERSLCELLQVSRNTLRAALAQMKKEGRIRPVHGAGNQILGGAAVVPTPLRAGDVALLTPEPIERLRPMQSLWIDDMRALLSERGVRLRVFHGRHYFAANPGPALQKLVARNPHGCWLLMLAGEHVQRWFSKNEIPCIVAGSTHPGVELPFRDLDHRAMCRHAAGVLLGLGHRRLVMLTQKSRRAGDLESEAGFVEGVRQSKHAEADAVVVHHEETVAGVAQAVRRILKLQPRPTALLIAHPHYYLAVASRLAQAGVHIPQEISLISRDDDPFLAFIAPTPARYVASPHVMAKSLLRPVLELLEGGGVTQRASLIMPEFLRGESIAAPA